MDILCPKCGEPWDADELHDAYLNGVKLSYREAWRKFQRVGCAVFETTCGPADDSFRTAAASAVYDLLGDDVDGAAAMLEDLDEML